MTTFTIGQLAERSGVGVETIRFYERRGLIPDPRRGPSGYRQFDESAVRRLRFVRRAKELGFKLDEIRELLALRVEPGVGCADVRQRAEAKLADVEARIRSLQAVHAALAELAGNCTGRGPTSDCPILAALDTEAER